jgi:hypothetical protein
MMKLHSSGVSTTLTGCRVRAAAEPSRRAHDPPAGDGQHDTVEHLRRERET